VDTGGFLHVTPRIQRILTQKKGRIGTIEENIKGQPPDSYFYSPSTVHLLPGVSPFRWSYGQMNLLDAGIRLPHEGNSSALSE
jgi:hypothetical protein